MGSGFLNTCRVDRARVLIDPASLDLGIGGPRAHGLLTTPGAFLLAVVSW